jgi:hypothetical protein
VYQQNRILSCTDLKTSKFSGISLLLNKKSGVFEKKCLKANSRNLRDMKNLSSSTSRMVKIEMLSRSNLCNGWEKMENYNKQLLYGLTHTRKCGSVKPRSE